MMQELTSVLNLVRAQCRIKCQDFNFYFTLIESLYVPIEDCYYGLVKKPIRNAIKEYYDG